MSDFSYTQPFSNCSPMMHSLRKKLNVFIYVKYFPSKQVYVAFADGYRNVPQKSFPNTGKPVQILQDMEQHFGEEILLGNIIP